MDALRILSGSVDTENRRVRWQTVRNALVCFPAEDDAVPNASSLDAYSDLTELTERMKKENSPTTVWSLSDDHVDQLLFPVFLAYVQLLESSETEPGRVHLNPHGRHRFQHLGWMLDPENPAESVSLNTLNEIVRWYANQKL